MYTQDLGHDPLMNCEDACLLFANVNVFAEEAKIVSLQNAAFNAIYDKSV